MFQFAMAKWQECKAPITSKKEPLVLICRVWNDHGIVGHYFMSVDGNVYCRHFALHTWTMLVGFVSGTVEEAIDAP